MKTEIEPIEIYSGSIWEVELVKSLLENAEIEAFLKDENMGTLAPWYTAGGGAGSIKVIVSSLDYDRARIVIDEYENSRKEKERQ